uniref:Rhino n=1 Tax=Drosophila orena TaxID=7233 RepID=Q49BJ8_DROOR|nr:rhino [Drosophila orena]
MSGEAQRPNSGLVVGPANDHAEEYKVEKIVGKRHFNERIQYLVKWIDFPHENNTWEPMENVGNCLQLVCDFEAELFRRMKNASVTSERELNLSPSSSGPSITENSPGGSNETQQRSKPAQPMEKGNKLQVNRKEKENNKKMAGTTQNGQNRPKTLMPTTTQASSPRSTDVFNDNLSTATKPLNKTPRLHSKLTDLNLSESSDDETVGATSLNYQRARLPKQTTQTPPQPRELIEFPLEEHAVVPSKYVSPVQDHKKSQPLQSPSQSNDSDECSSTSLSSSSDLSSTESSSSSVASIKVAQWEPKLDDCSSTSLSSSIDLSSTESSSSSVALIKVAQSEPKTTSLDQIKLSLSSSDVATAGPAAFSLHALKGEARKRGAEKRESKCCPPITKTESASSSMGSSDLLQSMGLDLTDNDSLDVEMERVNGSPIKRQSNWNLPEPPMMPPVKQIKSRQPVNPKVKSKKEAAEHRVGQQHSITTHAPKLDVKKKAKTLPGGKRVRTSQDWRMPERKKPFGLDRGLELDVVHHSYQVGEHLFLFVSWKDCLAIDAVPLKDLKEAYPLQIIKYFQSLKIAVPK